MLNACSLDPDCHALLLWIIPQMDKFPRLRRYTLGERIETLLLQVLDLSHGCKNYDKKTLYPRLIEI